MKKLVYGIMCFAAMAAANAFAEDVHAAKTAGMNEHIAKPLDLNTLAKILKKWIS